MRIRTILVMTAATALLASCGKEESKQAKAPAATTTAAMCWRVYATNELSDDITVVEEPTHKVVATMKVGKRPRGMVVDGGTLYVALSGWPIAGPGIEEDQLPPPDKTADGVAVIDAAALKVTRVLRGFGNPEQLALSPDGKTLYSPDEAVNVVHAIGTDGTDHGSIATGEEPEGMAISPDGKTLLVGSEGGGKMTVIDTTSFKVVKAVPVGQRPRGAMFTPDGAKVYITNELGGEMITMDAKTLSVMGKARITGKAPLPMGVAVSADGSVFVATGRNGTLVKIAPGGEQTELAVGTRPWGVAASPDGKWIYTANGASNDVSVVDAASMKIITKLPAGQRPWGVKVGPLAKCGG